jgi:hypothetical protein
MHVNKHGQPAISITAGKSQEPMRQPLFGTIPLKIFRRFFFRHRSVDRRPFGRVATEGRISIRGRYPSALLAYLPAFQPEDALHRALIQARQDSHCAVAKRGCGVDQRLDGGCPLLAHPGWRLGWVLVEHSPKHIKQRIGNKIHAPDVIDGHYLMFGLAQSRRLVTLGAL